MVCNYDISKRGNEPRKEPDVLYNEKKPLERRRPEAVHSSDVRWL